VRSYYSLPPHVKVKVGPLKPSEFPNYDALTITIDGGEKPSDYDFLLSKDNKTLLRVTKLDLTKDPYAEVVKKIDVAGRPVRGNKDAKVTVVNYDDFQCPFCSRMHQTLFPDLLKEYGDRVQFIYKDFPLAEIHPWATRAAVDANCLAAQSGDAYWSFADYIHSTPHAVDSANASEAVDKLTLLQGQKHNLDLTKLQSCIKAQNQDAVKASVREGTALGVSATPTMFINGQEIEGAQPVSELRAALDHALEQAGMKPPSHPSEPAGAAKPSQ